MVKQFRLDGVDEKVEFGKDGNVLDMSNGFASIESSVGGPIEMRGANATHSSAFVTKSQLDTATGNDSGTVWIEYTTKPTISNFSANTPKVVDLTQGAADLKTDYSTIPSNITWDGSDARTYIIDTTNGLITPNSVSKQPHTISVEFEYSDWGSGTNTGVGAEFSLTEHKNGTDHYSIVKQWRKANNDSGTGVVTLDFHTNVTNHVDGSGRGWRLYVTSFEGDSNATIKIKSIRLKAG